MKAGADQRQQRRHGEMGVAWWVWPCGCRVGLRDGPRRCREVGQIKASSGVMARWMSRGGCGRVGVPWVCEMGLAALARWRRHGVGSSKISSSYLAFWQLYSRSGQRQSLSPLTVFFFLKSLSLCLASTLFGQNGQLTLKS